MIKLTISRFATDVCVVEELSMLNIAHNTVETFSLYFVILKHLLQNY